MSSFSTLVKPVWKNAVPSGRKGLTFIPKYRDALVIPLLWLKCFRIFLVEILSIISTGAGHWRNWRKIKDTHPKPLTATYLCRLLTPDRLGGKIAVGCVRLSNQNFLMRSKYLDTIIYSLCFTLDKKPTQWLLLQFYMAYIYLVISNKLNAGDRLLGWLVNTYAIALSMMV